MRYSAQPQSLLPPAHRSITSWSLCFEVHHCNSLALLTFNSYSGLFFHHAFYFGNEQLFWYVGYTTTWRLDDFCIRLYSPPHTISSVRVGCWHFYMLCRKLDASLFSWMTSAQLDPTATASLARVAYEVGLWAPPPTAYDHRAPSPILLILYLMLL